MGYKILVADDEQEIRDLLRLYLEKDGYEIYEATDGIQAFELVKKIEFDMALVDIMMPKMDGYRLIKKIREMNNIPIMVLSAKIQDADKILGLDLGADDYITKPFNPLEVLARVKSGLRRFHSFGSKKQETENIKVRDLVLDTEGCVLYRGEQIIELTSVEFKLMELFMKNPGKVYTKQQLFTCGWGEENYLGADNNIMVCISKLRNKLEDSGEEYIKTVRGLGYRLEK